MQQIKQLNITQYKNYPATNFTFAYNIVGICGLNGKGKTNLLDAIYHICFAKSYFNRLDSQNIQFGTNGFRLEAILQNNTKIVLVNKGVGKKDIFLNDVLYQKFSEHIGKFPVVMIAPDDTILINGSSEERRKFLDTLIAQIDAEYLQQLITYNKILLQRNSALKQFAEQQKVDELLYETLTNQLLEPANYIFNKREQICKQLILSVKSFYKSISNNQEEIKVTYNSQLLQTDFLSLQQQNKQKDLITQRTNGGIHKDDIDIFLGENLFKHIASQGQKKSMLFALKLSEFDLLKKNKGFAPFLLLDDVFEKLDEQRMHNLLEEVIKNTETQVFITDTHKERLQQTLQKMTTEFEIIELT